MYQHSLQRAKLSQKGTEEDSLNTNDSNVTKISNSRDAQNPIAYEIKIQPKQEWKDTIEQALQQNNSKTVFPNTIFQNLLGRKNGFEPMVKQTSFENMKQISGLMGQNNPQFMGQNFQQQNQQNLINAMNQSAPFIWLQQQNLNSLEPTIHELKQQILNRKIFNTQLDQIQTNEQQGHDIQTIQNNLQEQLIQRQLLQRQKLQELRSEILTTLPLIVSKDQFNTNQNGCSQINKLLLDYFVHTELSINQTNSSSKDEKMQQKQQSSTNSHYNDSESIHEHEDFPSKKNSKKLDKISLDNFEQQTQQKVMLITKCPHVNRKHYAKNMCSSCYRKYGRNQNAWNCSHNDRLLYSMGMCQTCYLSDYHKVKKLQIKHLIEKKQNWGLVI